MGPRRKLIYSLVVYAGSDKPMKNKGKSVLMCLNPVRMPDGKYVACRTCMQCLQAATMEWTGRCIAEKFASGKAHFVTLTYGEEMRIGGADHLASAVLQYRHVQAFLKRLRHKYPCRFFAVGEYGEEKGRAHWHLIIFWKDKVHPDIVMDKRFNWEPWPHGFSHFKEAYDERIAYMCKYMNKGDSTIEGNKSKQTSVKMSKQPPIGSVYIMDLAEKYVDAGLAPQDLYYNFGKGAKYRYFMKGSFAELYIKMYLMLWNVKQEGRPVPESNIVMRFADKWEREDLSNFVIEPKVRRMKREEVMRPPAPLYAPPGWDEMSHQWLTPPYDPVENTYWVWYKDEKWFLRPDSQGKEQWITMKGDGGNAVRNGNKLGR